VYLVSHDADRFRQSVTELRETARLSNSGLSRQNRMELAARRADAAAVTQGFIDDVWFFLFARYRS
jgi:hypothetical protein